MSRTPLAGMAAHVMGKEIAPGGRQELMMGVLGQQI